MTIVKSLQLRKNLKELLKSSYDDKLILDYYGELFEIVPIKQNTKKLTKAQETLEYFKNRKRHSFADNSIFNEADPAQEKANFRNLRYSRYE